MDPALHDRLFAPSRELRARFDAMPRERLYYGALHPWMRRHFAHGLDKDHALGFITLKAVEWNFVNRFPEYRAVTNDIHAGHILHDPGEDNCCRGEGIDQDYFFVVLTHTIAEGARSLEKRRERAYLVVLASEVYLDALAGSRPPTLLEFLEPTVRVECEKEARQRLRRTYRPTPVEAYRLLPGEIRSRVTALTAMGALSS